MGDELPEVPDLDDFTEGDLNELLQIDRPMLTIPSINSNENQNSNQESMALSLMDFNRQPLPTQMSENFSRPRDNFQIENTENFNITLPWTDNATSALELSSLIMCTQDVEQIVLNDTTIRETQNRRKSQQAIRMNLDAPPASSRSVTLVTSSENSSNSSNMMHFPLVDKIKEEISISENAEDFELMPLDVDFEQLATLERIHSSQNVKQRREFQTQLPNFKPPREFDTKHEISISCPAPVIRRPLSSTKSNSSFNDFDAVNYLALDFGSETKSQNYFDLSMRGGSREHRPPAVVKWPNSYNNNSKAANVPNQQQKTQMNISAANPHISMLHFSEHHNNSILSIPDPATSRQRANDHDDDIEDNPLNLSAIHATDVGAANSVVSFNRLVANNSTADVTTIPLSVKQLFDVIKKQYSDFAFVYALSAQLCQDRVPMDCFVSLKMGLLLSLASIGSNSTCPPLPVVAIGNDSYMINYLLTEVGQLAARFVGPNDDYKPPSTAGYRNVTWIEADPIMLAKGGVFYIGDWSCLKTARADKIFKDIECWRVSIERSKNNYPLETAIWTHWRTFKGNAKEQQYFNKFVKIFGIPLHVDDSNHEVLVDYTLKQSSVNIYESTVDYLSISSQDMRDYLAVISKRTVDLTPDAMLLLQKYFVAARVSRPDCFTKQAFVSLKQFAESFAKLAFRHEVLTIDVVAAIYLCENFMQHIFGASSNPPPPFEAHNFVGLVDGHLSQFNEWLQGFIEEHEEMHVENV